MIKNQKLLYHLTNIRNLDSILERGLQPRSNLESFYDVADQDILAGRSERNLEKFVPFHWFARNPFDGRVQKDNPSVEFVLITVQRTLAKQQNWRVIPEHPLSKTGPRLYDYEQGFDLIDWDLLESRDYKNDDCKRACMAECLSSKPVPVKDFFMIFMATDLAKERVTTSLEDRNLKVRLNVNQSMFS